MRITLLILLCWLVGSVKSNAQHWFQEGNTWTYDVTTGWDGSNYGLHSLQVTGDSLRDGIVWRKIRYRQITQPDAYFLARVWGNKVLAKQLYGDAIHRIYDFDAAPGDTLHYSGDGAYYRVVDTSSVFIANKWRRQQVIHFSDIPMPYQLIEGLGITGRTDLPLAEYVCSFLLPNFPFCTGAVDGYDFRFRCFEEANGNRYSPLNICLQVDTSTQTGEEGPSLWPNPTMGILFLKEEVEQVRVYQLDGREIPWVQLERNSPTQVLLPPLPSSIYIVETRDTKGIIRRHRVAYHSLR
jgi:hypothetical protein